jgi:alpha-mannosidase
LTLYAGNRIVNVSTGKESSRTIRHHSRQVQYLERLEIYDQGVYMRLCVFASCLLLFFSVVEAKAFQAPVERTQAGPSDSPGPKLFVIPHTHWEGAVFKTREEYLEDGLPNIEQALHLLRTYPEYRFVLDQAAYVKPFLERYPEDAAEFRSFVSQGRLQIVGGTDVMLDSNIPSGESWIRQVLYGKGYFRKALGIDVNTGWAIDTFGHNDQMPQLLKLAGFNSYWFQRGVSSEKTPSEFLWSGVDGTKIPAFWLPQSYGLFYPAPRNLIQFDGYAVSLWEALGYNSKFPDRVALAGADVVRPEEELPRLIRMFNAQQDAPFKMRFAVPEDFEKLAARRTDRPVVQGELNPVFQGTYSNRIELKQWMREDERLLTNAEKLASVAGLLGTSSPSTLLWQAWEPVLFNQAHDLTSGTMVDKVYRETIQGYQQSRDGADRSLHSSLAAIAAEIDTRYTNKEAIPVLVFNTLGSQRTDIAQAEIQFHDLDVNGLELYDSAGGKEPVQVVEVKRDSSGSIQQAKVAFIARDLPSMGWALYFIVPRHEKNISDTNYGLDPVFSLSSSTRHVDSASIENKFYRTTFDLWTGAITGLELKDPSGNWQVLGNQSANIVACEQDGGDSWELYGNLNGARLTAMKRTAGLPQHDRSHFSNEWVGGNGKITTGPVFSEFHIEHPLGDNGFSTRVRVYSDIQRIDFETKLVDRDKFVRYRLLFPTSLQSGQRFDEIPFAAIRRPESQEFPAQNWIDWGNGEHGVALLNVGLPGSNVSGGTLLLSLMRSAHINTYRVPEGHEAESSDLGFELGQERTFDYALVPHDGTWQQARIVQSGLEFNDPLLVMPLEQHSGKLSRKWGLLQISSPAIVLSALMPAEDGHGIILRVYEAMGQAARNVNIRFNTQIQSASEVNLLEDQIRSLPPGQDSIDIDLRPFEIKTFRLQLKPIGP